MAKNLRHSEYPVTYHEGIFDLTKRKRRLSQREWKRRIRQVAFALFILWNDWFTYILTIGLSCMLFTEETSSHLTHPQ